MATRAAGAVNALSARRYDVTVNLAGALAARSIGFIPVDARKLHQENRIIELADGRSVDYDYFIIATGPRLAFDEPEGHVIRFLAFAAVVVLMLLVKVALEP